MGLQKYKMDVILDLVFTVRQPIFKNYECIN